MWNGCMFAYAFQGTALYRLGDFILRFESSAADQYNLLINCKSWYQDEDKMKYDGCMLRRYKEWLIVLDLFA